MLVALVFRLEWQPAFNHWPEYQNPGWYCSIEDQHIRMGAGVFPGYGWIDLIPPFRMWTRNRLHSPTKHRRWTCRMPTSLRMELLHRSIQLPNAWKSMTQSALFHDKDYEQRRRRKFRNGRFTATVSKDTGSVPLCNKEGHACYGCIFAEALKDIKAMMMTALPSVLKTSAPVPVDQVKSSILDAEAKQKKAQEEAAKQTNRLG